jgi:hypothetical protein
MGFHVSWLAVRGKTPEAVRKELELRETDRREFLPESDVTGVLLPSGWYVIFFNEALAAEVVDEPALSRLSQGAVVMVFIVEETSMVSMARGYADGARTWQVAHDANAGLDHLDVAGTPPPTFDEVKDKLLDKLAKHKQNADYLFDLPANLCKSITGFRHDEDIEGMDGDAFTVLERP